MRAEGFDRWAPCYDDGALQPMLYHAMHDDVLRKVTRLNPRPARMADLGCGTGHLLCLAAGRLPATILVGVDHSTGMLDVAARNAPDARLVLADVGCLPFADAAFDVITCTATVRHWQDLRRGLAEAARVLTGGGLLALADFFPRQLRPAWPPARRAPDLPTCVLLALHAAGLRLAAVREVDGYGPVSHITVALARKPDSVGTVPRGQ